ncbi:membrane spanning protein [Staphylococcus piscifermentans]|uniref:Membrane protein n=1 Tax=Staphylococcus piscifermentans TaxID=70258 RepID=A0A239TLJ6_9STAP|nr:PTS sugar transporter subunit IIC [Staphylococcus piscifermentans]RTX86185.1 PTS transporter subunit IIC [Staphylococcus piscifermentans]GEP84885.1 membrane protein [Staphylococcus piscifermentans]SNU98425.1 membrane spanning protein [Staphylococcus piscifermentans]
MEQTLTKPGTKIGPKQFLFNLLNGVAIGIVAALIPNAILGEILRALIPFHPIFKMILSVSVLIQYTAPCLIGAVVAYRFRFSPLGIAVVAASASIGSGQAVFKNGAWVLLGMGDLINAMFATALACMMILLIGERFGSLNLIILPTFVAVSTGFITVHTLPYVRLVTTSIGSMINYFTELQPIPMCILISLVYASIVISPISTAALSMAIGITGLAAGSASIGIASVEAVLTLGTLGVNRLGVPLAIFLGGVKMMLPNLVKHPIIFLPLTTTAVVSGFVASLIGIGGTKQSAGFGIIGLVGPINAFRFLEGDNFLVKVALCAVAFFVVPFITAFIVHFLFIKVFKIYDKDIFRFLG